MSKRKTRTSARRSTRTRELQSELASLEQALQEALQARLSKARSVSSHDPTEFLDQASDGELDDLALRLAESDAVKIEEIEEALSSLREGNYGICLACGKKISKRRLKARPFATLCLACKQKQEQHWPDVSRTVPGEAREGAGADVGVGDLDDDAPPVDELFRDVESSDIL